MERLGFLETKNIKRFASVALILVSLFVPRSNVNANIDVVGGRTVNRGEFPHLVYDNETGCTANIIGNNLILGASHCLTNAERKYGDLSKVYSIGSDRSNPEQIVTTCSFSQMEPILDPQPGITPTDIYIAKTCEPIQFNEYVTATQYVNMFDTPTYTIPYTVTVAGFGKTDPSNPNTTTPIIAQTADVLKLSDDQYDQISNQLFNMPIQDGFTCIGDINSPNNGQQTPGDSGSLNFNPDGKGFAITDFGLYTNTNNIYGSCGINLAYPPVRDWISTTVASYIKYPDTFQPKVTYNITTENIDPLFYSPNPNTNKTSLTTQLFLQATGDDSVINTGLNFNYSIQGCTDATITPVSDAFTTTFNSSSNISFEQIRPITTTSLANTIIANVTLTTGESCNGTPIPNKYGYFTLTAPPLFASYINSQAPEIVYKQQVRINGNIPYSDSTLQSFKIFTPLVLPIKFNIEDTYTYTYNIYRQIYFKRIGMDQLEITGNIGHPNFYVTNNINRSYTAIPSWDESLYTVTLPLNYEQYIPNTVKDYDISWDNPLITIP